MNRRITDHEIISLADWNLLDRDTKEYALYANMAEMNNWRNSMVQDSKDRQEICLLHFQRLDKRKWIDRGTAVFSGFVGGFIAMISFLILKWETIKEGLLK